jgi:hypothetical protein
MAVKDRISRKAFSGLASILQFVCMYDYSEPTAFVLAT